MPSVPLNSNGGARRRVRAQVLAEETHCALCGEPVDKTLTMAWGQHSKRCTDASCAGCAPHPWRAEVDEIITRAFGGSPIDRRNCQLTHRTCNLTKGDGKPKPKPVLRTPLPTSRDWRSGVGGLPSPRR